MSPEIVSLWTHRRALSSLVRHDLRKTYAGTVLGVAWAVLLPLIPIAIFTAVFTKGIRLPMGRAPYLLAFTAAYIPWTFFSTSVAAAAGSFVEHRYLVKRLVFPIEIIPADPLLVHALPHAILVAIAAIAGGVAGFGHLPQLALVAYFFVCLAVLAFSAGLFLASLTVLIRDVRQILPSVLQVLFWLTPIAWSPDHVSPKIQRALALNPASYVVAGYRHAVLPLAFPAPTPLATLAFWIIAMLMLAVAIVCFRRLRVHFWECV